MTAAEVTFVYHSIMHHHSYLSTECGMKLNKNFFHDSNLCKKVTCGRTKASAIAENVLGKLSIEKHVKLLVSENIKYSIACDASNKGNRKMFPIAIQYFTLNEGINKFVLDFYEDPNESSRAIYENIKEKLNSNKLNIQDLIAYTADNASVNYGQHKSVFTN